MNSITIRRLILTLATGYLTVFGVRQIPYEFPNEWLVLIPALVLAYALTIWLEGKIFKDEVASPVKTKPQRKSQNRRQRVLVRLKPVLLLVCLKH